jgi:ribose transport system ATP-binding protein
MTQAGSSTPLLQMRGIVKTFPGVRALDGVDLAVRAGEVHCLLGQNGAGKSTLIKVLAGAHRPDAGEIFWDGEPVTLSNPTGAMRLGIATIYQELDLVDGLTTAENIFLGHEPSLAGFLQRLTARARARDLLERLGHGEIPPGRELGNMSAAGKQIVSMARALSHEARLIVMDEPSAVLDQGEVENLFRVIRDLTADGVAVIYISHRLEEIREIGDRATVLKDGRTVGTGLPAKDTPTADIIRLMTGRTMEYTFPPRPGDEADAELVAGTDPPPVLRVRGLSRRREFSDISFDVRPGEVIGLAGLVGSGRSEVLETVFGARKAMSGTVEVHGRKLRPGSVRAAVNAGMQAASHIDVIWNHDDDQGIGVKQAFNNASREEFFFMGGAGSCNAMEWIQDGEMESTVLYPPTQAADGVRLARLIAQNRGVSDLVQVEVPRRIELNAPVVTSENVDEYLPLCFES